MTDHLTIGQIARELNTTTWLARRIVDRLGVVDVRIGQLRLVRRSKLDTIRKALANHKSQCV